MNTITTTISTATVRTWIAAGNTRRRLLDDERGEVSSSLVWVAGFVLAAIAIIGILYAKLNTAAEGIDVDPGV